MNSSSCGNRYLFNRLPRFFIFVFRKYVNNYLSPKRFKENAFFRCTFDYRKPDCVNIFVKLLRVTRAGKSNGKIMVVYHIFIDIYIRSSNNESSDMYLYFLHFGKLVEFITTFYNLISMFYLVI